MMTIEPASASAVTEVALRMRADDYEEFSAVSFSHDRDELARVLTEKYGGRHDVLVGAWEGNPICIGGFIMARPNVITLLFFATDEFRRIGLGITRFVKNNLFPRLEDQGVHRFEAVSHATHAEAHRWLRALGLEQETEPMPGYGRDGSAYIQFARVKNNGVKCAC